MNPIADDAAALPQTALHLAVLKELAEQVKAAYEAARSGVTAQMASLRERLGLKTIEVRLPDTGVIAQITLSTPTIGVAVLYEDLFVDRCAKRHPEHVMEVPAHREVREAFRKLLLGRLIVTDVSSGQDGSALAVVDPITGEAMGWATTTPQGKPTPSLTWKTDGRAAVAHAWRTGRLRLPEHMPLPAAEK